MNSMTSRETVKTDAWTSLASGTAALKDAFAVGNWRVIKSLVGPALRGFVLGRGRSGEPCAVPARGDACFDFTYQRDRPQLAALYSRAKQSQWDGATGLPWDTSVDPDDPTCPLLEESLLPLRELPEFHRLSAAEQTEQRRSFVSWILSQFLHGEQGALMAACQVTQAVRWMDGKLYGSTQVVDEGRHVEVFHRYITDKLGKLYVINDNLYVIIDALMTDSRWDVKFLGMQIMIEGLALGAFGTLRASTREPLLRDLLTQVIADEARHVHFGVLALREHCLTALSASERREREDWAFEMALLMRNRFLAHEFHAEYWGHKVSRARWDQTMQASPFMGMFRKTMFRRIVPNLKSIGLLSDRIRPYYDALGLLAYENEKAAPDLSAAELLEAPGEMLGH